MIEVRVPDEQEGTKAVVRGWLKKIGDTVAVNDPLVELETDKVTQEVPSPAAGVLREILLDSDAEAMPGALLGRIAVGGASEAPVAAAQPAAAAGRLAVRRGETGVGPRAVAHRRPLRASGRRVDGSVRRP